MLNINRAIKTTITTGNGIYESSGNNIGVLELSCPSTPLSNFVPLVIGSTDNYGIGRIGINSNGDTVIDSKDSSSNEYTSIVFQENNGRIKIGNNTSIFKSSFEIDSSSSIIIPRGTTNERQSMINNTNGMIRYNYTYDNFEAYKNNIWSYLNNTIYNLNTSNNTFIDYSDNIIDFTVYNSVMSLDISGNVRVGDISFNNRGIININNSNLSFMTNNYNENCGLNIINAGIKSEILHFSNTGDVKYSLPYNDVNTPIYFHFKSDNDDIFTIKKNNKIGINISEPMYDLHIHNVPTTEFQTILTLENTTSSIIEFRNSMWSQGNVKRYVNFKSESGNFTINNMNGESISILENGYFGINITPTEPLHVSDKMRVLGGIDISNGIILEGKVDSPSVIPTSSYGNTPESYEILAVENQWQAEFLRLRAGGMNNVSTAAYIDIIGDNVGTSNNNEKNAIAFYTNNTRRMCVQQNGNLVIGENASKAANHVQDLYVEGNLGVYNEIRIGNSTTSNRIEFPGITSNTDGAFNDSYRHTFIEERIYAGTQASELLFYKANDGFTTTTNPTNTSAAGPDRIRLKAKEFIFECSTGTSTAFSGNPKLHIIRHGLPGNAGGFGGYSWIGFDTEYGSGGNYKSTFSAATLNVKYEAGRTLRFGGAVWGKMSDYGDGSLRRGSLYFEGAERGGYSGIAFDSTTSVNEKFIFMSSFYHSGFYKAFKTEWGLVSERSSATKIYSGSTKLFQTTSDGAEFGMLCPTMGIATGVSSAGAGPEMDYPVYVSNSVVFSMYTSPYYYGTNGAASRNTTYTNEWASCFFQADLRIGSGNSLFSVSDVRNKTDFENIDYDYAIHLLMNIQSCHYKYIDQVHRGRQVHLGFIAQQVSEVMPYAVTMRNGFVPNKYKTITDKAWIKISNEKYKLYSHEFTSDVSGVSFKFYVFDEETNIRTVYVTGNSDNSFTFKEKWSNVFRVGEYVNDFHTIAKRKLWCLNFVATQGLDHYLVIQKETIHNLQSEIDNNQHTISALENELNSILNRLNNIII
jgi:hypothetical protein